MNIHLIGAVILWGLNYPISKSVLGYLDPISFTAWRFLLALPFLWFYLIKTRRHRIEPRDLAPFLGTACYGIGAYQILYIFSLFYTSSNSTSLLISACPIFTFMILWFGRKLNDVKRSEISGLLLGITGVALILMHKPDLSFGLNPWLGNFLGLLASVIWGSGPILSQRWLVKYSPESYITYSFTMVAILFWLMTPLMSRSPWPIPGPAIPGVLFSAVGAGALGHIAWFKGVADLGSKKECTICTWCRS